MPYPLLKLPYGLQNRLCELATSREKYLLQSSAGLMNHHLKPKQHNLTFDSPIKHTLKMIDNSLQLVSNCYSGIWNSRFSQNDPPDHETITIETKLLLSELNEADFDDSFLDQTILKMDQLEFYHSSMSDSILQRISSKCLAPVLEFEAVNLKDCAEVNIGRVLELFPHLENVYISQLSMKVQRNWIKDILDSKKRGLKKLYLEGTFDNLLNFNRNELVQLFKTQTESFILMLTILDVPPINALHTISNKVDEAYFETKHTEKCPFFHVRHRAKEDDPNFLYQIYHFYAHEFN